METSYTNIISNQDKIICPIIAVWIILFLNFININESYFIRYYEKNNLFILLIIVYNLIFSFFITLGIEQNNYCLYLDVLIMSIIFGIGMAILFLFSSNAWD